MWFLGATRGIQGLAMIDIWSSETFMQEKWVEHLKICLKIRQSLLSPTWDMVARGNQRHTRTCKDGYLKFWDFIQEKWVKHLKICLKIRDSLLSLEIPYYHPLRMWLLGATRGIQGLAMMDIWSSDTFIQENWVKHLKMCLKIRDSLLSST